MTKITNLELTSQHGPKSFIARMGLEDKVIKLKASHSASNVARILNEKHPKENGNPWTKEDVKNFIRKYKARCMDIAATNPSVCDEVSKTVIDSVKGIEKMNTLLNGWIDNIDENRIVECQECGNHIKVFDTDKAVRLCAEIRRTLVTSHQLTGGLPDVEQRTENVSKAVEFTQMLDKMISDGTIVLVKDKTELSSQVVETLGEK